MQELKFNKRRKLDRFLATLPEDMVFKSNNEFRIKMPDTLVLDIITILIMHLGGIGILNTIPYKKI